MGERRVRRFVVAAISALALLLGVLVVAQPVQAASKIPGWLHTEGATIRTAGGAEHIIRGAAWFGMETSNCAPHGLWSIGLDSGLAQIASMGFNTIRLPYSNECLAASAPNSINFHVNPDLQGLSPLQLMDRVIAKAKSYGLAVILDRHRPDSGSQSELWYTAQYSEARWIADWKMLAARYKNEPAVIGVDLHNEPHGPACWGCGDPAVDWQAAATRAGNAVLSVNPRLLILVEGVQQLGGGASTWWGGGLSGVAGKPVTLSVPGRVVYSPHDYPVSIHPQTWFSAPNYPDNLTTVWTTNWGYLDKQNIAPVLVGEFGTRLATTSDKQWLAKMVSYLKTYRMSYAYWSFNPNSGDTGGLVKDDWVTPETAKLTALAPILGPRTVVTPTPPAPVPTTTAAPPTATATPKPTLGPSPTATPKPTVTPRPTVTPTPTATPKPTTTPAAATATWSLSSSWAEGYVANIAVASATGASTWTVSWADPTVTSVVNSWGMTCRVVVKTSVTCTGDSWVATLSPGQSATVGLQVASTRAPVAPNLTVSAK